MENNNQNDKHYVENKNAQHQIHSQVMSYYQVSQHMQQAVLLTVHPK